MNQNAILSGNDFALDDISFATVLVYYDTVILKPESPPSGWSYLWSNGSGEDHIVVKATGIGFSMQTYTLAASTADGCEFSRSITVIFDFGYCFGIGEEKQDSPVRIVPNPNKGKFRISLDHPGDFREIFIYSPVAGKVFEKSITGKNYEIDFDLHDLPAGLYILYLQGSDHLFSRKVILLP